MGARDADLPADVSLRTATPEDRVGVRRVLDAAALAVEDVPDRLAAGDVLVAVADGRVVGAIVLDPDGPRSDREDAPSTPDAVDAADATHVSAVAVRRRRRARGIGTALVEAALDREGRLVADFDPRVRPFYEALAFSISEADGRCWGVREA